MMEVSLSGCSPINFSEFMMVVVFELIIAIVLSIAVLLKLFYVAAPKFLHHNSTDSCFLVSFLVNIILFTIRRKRKEFRYFRRSCVE